MTGFGPFGLSLLRAPLQSEALDNCASEVTGLGAVGADMEVVND